MCIKWLVTLVIKNSMNEKELSKSLEVRNLEPLWYGNEIINYKNNLFLNNWLYIMYFSLFGIVIRIHNNQL